MWTELDKTWLRTVKAYLTPEGCEGQFYKKSDHKVVLGMAVGKIERLRDMLTDTEEDLKNIKATLQAEVACALAWCRKTSEVEKALAAERDLVSDMEAINNDLRTKLDREIAVSRSMAQKLELADRKLADQTELNLLRDELNIEREMTRRMAEHFIGLHDLAKAVVGPKMKVVPEAQHSSRQRATLTVPTSRPASVSPTWSQFIAAGWRPEQIRAAYPHVVETTKTFGEMVAAAMDDND